MKNLLLVFVFLSSACFALIPVEVVRIVDGDTIKVKLESGNKFSIRLQGIDCYETSKIHRAYKQAYENKLDINDVIKNGNNATQYLKELYKKSSKTSFDFRGIDKYGRALGIVYFDNLNINQELKNKKLCMPYEYKE